jgi:hypothetical protein
MAKPASITETLDFLGNLDTDLQRIKSIVLDICQSENFDDYELNSTTVDYSLEDHVELQQFLCKKASQLVSNFHHKLTFFMTNHNGIGTVIT